MKKICCSILASAVLYILLEVNCQKNNFSPPPSVRFHNYPLYSFFKLKTGNRENVLKADNRVADENDNGQVLNNGNARRILENSRDPV